MVYDMTTGQTGTVCSKYWDDIDATVMCKIYGSWNNGTAKFLPRNETLPRLIYGVHCMGTEHSLAECQLDLNVDASCDYMEDAGFNCGQLGQLPLNFL